MEVLVTRVLKIILYTFNTIILIYGLFITVCGLLIVKDMKSFGNFMESKILWLPYFITFNGFHMVVLAVLGYWATFRQNYKLLFFISTVIVLLIELALITWISSGDPRFSDQLRTAMTKSFNNYKENDQEIYAWHKMQKKIKCCGISSPSDWSKIPNIPPNQAPVSCCINVPGQPPAVCRIIDTKTFHQTGCHSVLFKRISDHWSAVSLLAAIAAFVQVIVLLLSVLMASMVKRTNSARVQ